MNRRRYDSGRFDKSSDSYNRKEYAHPRKSSNFKDDFRGRYQNSSKYFEDSKYSYKNSSSRSGEDHRMKRSRNDDSRLSSSYMSNHRRNDIRPKTPPPPTIRSSGSSYARGSTHRNNDSSRHTSSYRNTYSPSRRRQGMNGPRGTTQRYNPRLRAPIRRDNDVRPRIIRRKIIVSSSRKFNSIRNDRSRIIRLAKIKRTRDSLKSKTTSSKKSARENGTDEEDDENETKKSDREKSENAEEKSSKKNEPDEDKEEEDDGENVDKKEVKKEKSSKDEEKPKKSSEDSTRKRRSAKRESATPERKAKPFIKLVCVHCKIKCRTFNEYQHHLYNRTHRMAMRRISIRQKSQLSRMRLEQRKAQKELEDNTKEDLGDSQYCLLCRLNYKTGKAKHQISDHHKTMKKFLMPYCSTCHIAFKSPTVYQSHRCSLEHIKRKARDNKSDTDDSDTEMQVDLKDFTTVDSIGEIDDDDLDGSAGEDIELDDESMGIKFVKKVEALYCEMCESYVSQDLTNEEEITLKHCKTKLHLKLTRKAAAKAQEEELAAEEAEANDESKLEEDGVKEEEDEEMSAEKPAVEDNEDDENDENILNLDILSEKNGKENEIIDDTANTAED